jgi:hypothetical protein
MAAAVGAWVLVDEVYLDLVPESEFSSPFRTSARYGEQFVVTNSLTKAYGLSGIRCGWILAKPELAKRIRRVDDLMSGSPVFPAELLGSYRARSPGQDRGAGGEAACGQPGGARRVSRFREDLEVFRAQWGTIAFPRLPKWDGRGVLRIVARGV